MMLTVIMTLLLHSLFSSTQNRVAAIINLPSSSPSSSSSLWSAKGPDLRDRASEHGHALRIHLLPAGNPRSDDGPVRTTTAVAVVAAAVATAHNNQDVHKSCTDPHFCTQKGLVVVANDDSGGGLYRGRVTL